MMMFRHGFLPGRRGWLALVVGFVLLLFYFRLVNSFGLTTVHVDTADLGFRDEAMFLSYSNFGDSTGVQDIFHKLRLLFDYAMVTIHGPLQFLSFNIYVALIGNAFPLNPTTFVYLRAIIAALCGVYAYLFGKQADSPKFGYILAATCIFSPWFGIAVRFSAIYSLLIVLLHWATLYYYTNFIRNPRAFSSRFMAPLALALYLMTGLDWPFFIPLLMFYLSLNRRLRMALYNRYNVFPMIIFLSQLAFAVRLYFTGEYGFDRWKVLPITYPFMKILLKFGNVNIPGTIWEILSYLLRSYGIGWFLALLLAGTCIYKALRSRRLRSPDWRVNFLLCNACWVVILSYPFVKSSTDHLTYAFAMAVPIAYLTAVIMTKSKSAFVIGACLMLMVVWQWSVFLNRFPKTLYTFSQNDYKTFADDRRVLAAAVFLIERRPDLLAPGKVALLPRVTVAYPGNPGFVNDYARGGYTRIRPWLLEPFNNGMPEQIFYFVKPAGWKFGEDELSYVDWVLLSDELISEKFVADQIVRDYYSKVFKHRSISWLGCFRDVAGRAFYLGEMKKTERLERHTAFEDQPVYQVEEFARVYEEKQYDYLDYLKQDLAYHIYFW